MNPTPAATDDGFPPVSRAEYTSDPAPTDGVTPASTAALIPLRDTTWSNGPAGAMPEYSATATSK